MIKVETKNFIGEVEKERDVVIGQVKIPEYRFRVFPKDWEKVIDDKKTRFRSNDLENEWYECVHKLFEKLEKENKLFIAFINSNFDGVPERDYFKWEGNPLTGVIEVWDEDGYWETYLCSADLTTKYSEEKEFLEELQKWVLNEFLYLVGAGKYYGSWEYGEASIGRLMVYVGWMGTNLPYCEQIDAKYCGTYGEHLIRLKKNVEGVGEKGEEIWLCDTCLGYLSKKDYEYIKHVYEELTK